MRVFLKGIPPGVVAYIRSRKIRAMSAGMPAAAVSAVLLGIFLRSGTSTNQQSRYEFYTELSTQALHDGDSTVAELFFARALCETTERQRATLEFAQQLYDESGAPDRSGYLMGVNGVIAQDTDPLTRRALMLIQSLAPRRHGVKGYAPAHQFLSEFWRSRIPHSDAAQVLSMHHDMLAAPSEVKPALQLAEFIVARGRFSSAIQLLRRFREENPDVLLLRARAYSKLDDLSSVNQCLRKATKLLREQLSREPHNGELRLKLSRAVATQGKILESMFVLVEGLGDEHSSRFVDQLVQRYVVWLSLMNPQAITSQITEIELALNYLNDEDLPKEVDQRAVLTTSSGEQFSLPAPIVRFHHALLEGQGEVLGPLLIGTDYAARGNFRAAITRLTQAHQKAPDHPVIANNLAWALTQDYTGASSPGESLAAVPDTKLRRNPQAKSSFVRGLTDSPDRRLPSYVSEAALQQAWQLANEAVHRCPDVISFRETRGTIAVITGHWPVAANDLQLCVAAGKTSARIRQLLALAQEHEQSGPDSDR